MSLTDTLSSPAEPIVEAAAASPPGQRRGIWVLVDQGIVSIGNFVIFRMMGRNLPEDQFGAYSLLFDTLLFLNTLQAAVIIYPLTVRGAAGDRSIRPLVTASLFFTTSLLVVLGTAMLVASLVVANLHVAWFAIGGMVLWQIQETLRRALIAEHRFRETLWGDAIRYLGQAAMIYGLCRMDRLTIAAAFLTISLSSVLAILVQAWQVGLEKVKLRQLGPILADFWVLGRWMFISNALSAVTGIIYPWTLVKAHGTAGPALNAAFQSITIFAKVANPVMASMAGLIIPVVARTASQRGRRAATPQALRCVAFGAALLLPCFLVLVIAPEFSMRLIWGRDSAFVENAPLLRLYVANYSMLYLYTVIGAWLQGLGEARANFYSQVANAAGTLLVGVPLTIVGGVSGLISGALVAITAAAVCCLVLLVRVLRNADATALPPAG